MACITKRRGRWVIDFYDQHGQRQRETLPKGTNKDEARKELREREKKVDNRTFFQDKKAPLFSKVAQDWLDYKKPKLRETTWLACQGHVNNHFEALKDLRINRITPAVVEKLITAKQEKDININTLRRVLCSLGQILSYGVRHRYLEYNPLREAERPRDLRKDEKEIRILTPEEIRSFLGAVEDQKYKTLFLMAIMTGARQGELLGLKWGDLDPEQKQVYIQRTYNHGQFFPTKSKYSKRKVDLSPTLLTELKKWKLACPKMEVKDTPELDMMFPNSVGKPMDCTRMLHNHFEPALIEAGIIQRDKKTKKIVGQRVRFHDMRHTYASLMIEQGENIKYIQTQLGHSSPVVTLNVYAHLMKPTNQEAVQKLENTIFETTGHNLVTEIKKELAEAG
jgi:integrase